MKGLFMGDAFILIITYVVLLIIKILEGNCSCVFSQLNEVCTGLMNRFFFLKLTMCFSTMLLNIDINTFLIKINLYFHGIRQIKQATLCLLIV